MRTNPLNRRGFMKAAGAAGAMLAANTSRSSYAANSKIRLGAIGTGGQGCKHIEFGIAGVPEFELTSLCDVFRPHREATMKIVDATYGEDAAKRVTAYSGDYRKMLDQEQLDAVVINTPTDLHYEMAMECLDRGLHVFCEKIIALEIEHARQIVTKCHETQRVFQVGHQRRCNPIYNVAMWIARETGAIGRIHHMAAHWHRNDDWRRYVDPEYTFDTTEAQYIHHVDRHLNWRLYRKRSGGPMVELGSHQTDIANWFLGTPPSRVIGYGGADYWCDHRDTEDNLSVIFEYDVPRSAKSFQPPQPRSQQQDPWQLLQPYQVRFEYSVTMANAKRGASETIFGDKGTMELSEAMGGRLYAEMSPYMDIHALFQSRSASQPGSVPAETHRSRAPQEIFTEGIPIRILDEGPGESIKSIGQREIDIYQFEVFADAILKNETPLANEHVGLLATISTVAAAKALRERTAVEIDPAWYAFDFAAPDPYRYVRHESPRIHEHCVEAYPPPILQSTRS